MKTQRVAALAVSLFAFSLFGAESTRFEQLKANKLTFSGGQAPSPVQSTTGEAPVVHSVASALRAGILRHATPSASFATQPVKMAGQQKARIAGTASVLYRENGTPRQIRITPSDHSLSSVNASAIDVARNFLRANAAILRIEDPDRELAVVSRTTDSLGYTHVRFEQQFEGMTVWPAELIVHLAPQGDVDLVEGGYIPTPRRMSKRPALSASDAIARAQKVAGGAKASVPELIVYARSDRRPRLAWKMTLSESLIEEWMVIVDAANGSILERFNTVQTANVVGSGRDLAGTNRQLNVWQQGSTFYLLDSSKRMFDPTSQAPSPQNTRGGIFVYDARNLPATDEPEELPPGLSVVSSNSATSWPVADTVSAAFWLAHTYDYFLDRHGRDSIDGQRGSLNAIVRLGLKFENAFWNQERGLMVFGDADTFAGSLDVIAHEMSHGVTGYSAKLVYRNQSGAINEAMSDIFGEMVEDRTNGNNDWLMGSGLSRPFRSMADPNRFGHPAKMSQFVNTTQDSGGVHINSGIINHAFYQLAQGLPGAIGKRDAERIFYRALTEHLTKDSQFIDLRLAAITSANELFGANSAQSRKTAEAFDAVEIFGAAPTPQEPPIPVVIGPDSTIFVYKDPSNGAFFLGRKETTGDGALGSQLSTFSVLNTRPSVSSDGSVAVFVDSLRDVCLILTNASEDETCLDLPRQNIRVSSVGMSPDGVLFGFVLFGSDGTPEPDIVVVNADTGASERFEVATPSYDGAALSTVEFADAMAFTADGQFLVYDALNLIIANGAPWEAWSIYALDLNSGEVFSVIPPIEGLDVAWPSLGHTSDNLMVFEAYDSSTGESGVITSDLADGTLVVADIVTGAEAVPSYTGDDRAIVYAAGASNPNGSNLMKLNLGPDHITPVGSRALWIEAAGFPVIYRRGTYQGPTTQPGALSFTSSAFNGVEGSTVTITVMRSAGNKGAASVNYSTSNGSATAGVDFQSATGTLTWADGDDEAKTFQVRLLTDSAAESAETLTLSLAGANGASIGSPSTSTLTIANSAAPPTSGRRRGVRR